MGKALYRKYRSKNLDEIVGQPHITDTLDNALKKGTFSHAYLFTGPRGTGKTSIARILAHEVNNLPYDENATHLDIIEIDAASNRRIDEIRELRDRVHIAPTSGKYKVYIIDEVHMLTKEAFNALLKTLEEPPAHVIFILATTEAHKLPETIISRTQRFTFKPVDKDTVIAHLKYIAAQEKINIHDDALALIAEHGGGSFRDSISLLDQVQGHGSKVTLKQVQAVLGIAPAETIDGLVRALQDADPAATVDLLQQARRSGYQAGQVAKQLAGRLRGFMLDGTSPIPSELIAPTLHKLVSVPAAYDPEAALEIALLDVVLAAKPLSQSINIEPAKPPEPKQPKKAAADTPPAPESQPIPEPLTASATLPATTPADSDIWQPILDNIKQTHNTLYSVARMATPQFKDDKLVLIFSFPFHQKRLNESKNKQIITDIARKVTGRPVTITCIVHNQNEPVPAPAAPPSKQDDTISTISNIFGGAELLD